MLSSSPTQTVQDEKDLIQEIQKKLNIFIAVLRTQSLSIANNLTELEYTLLQPFIRQLTNKPSLKGMNDLLDKLIEQVQRFPQTSHLFTHGIFSRPFVSNLCYFLLFFLKETAAYNHLILSADVRSTNLKIIVKTALMNSNRSLVAEIIKIEYQKREDRKQEGYKKQKNNQETLDIKKFIFTLLGVVIREIEKQPIKKQNNNRQSLQYPLTDFILDLLIQYNYCDASFFCKMYVEIDKNQEATPSHNDMPLNNKIKLQNNRVHYVIAYIINHQDIIPKNNLSKENASPTNILNQWLGVAFVTNYINRYTLATILNNNNTPSYDVLTYRLLLIYACISLPKTDLSIMPKSIFDSAVKHNCLDVGALEIFMKKICDEKDFGYAKKILDQAVSSGHCNRKLFHIFVYFAAENNEIDLLNEVFLLIEKMPDKKKEHKNNEKKEKKEKKEKNEKKEIIKACLTILVSVNQTDMAFAVYTKYVAQGVFLPLSTRIPSPKENNGAIEMEMHLGKLGIGIVYCALKEYLCSLQPIKSTTKWRIYLQQDRSQQNNEILEYSTQKTLVSIIRKVIAKMGKPFYLNVAEDEKMATLIYAPIQLIKTGYPLFFGAKEKEIWKHLSIKETREDKMKWNGMLNKR